MASYPVDCEPFLPTLATIILGMQCKDVALDATVELVWHSSATEHHTMNDVVAPVELLMK